MNVTIRFDGACQGNPGPRGIGYVLGDGERIIEEGSEAIGSGTSNEAEYYALIGGLEEAIEHGATEVTAIGDSELIVKQVRGEYSVNADNLQPLWEEVGDLVDEFEDFSIRHAPREKNEAADQLANEALDI